MANSKKTIFHAYAIVPLLAICAIHAIVWLGTKSLADFSRASDVTLGIDALFPLRPEWVVIYVATFLFWGMGLLLIARQDEQLCCRFAAGVVIGDLICGIIFIAFPSCIPRRSSTPPTAALSGRCRSYTPSTRRRTASRRCTACSPTSCSASRCVRRAQGRGSSSSAACSPCSCACRRCLSSSTSSRTSSAAFSSASYPSFWDKNCLCGKFLLKSIKNSCNLLRDVV